MTRWPKQISAGMLIVVFLGAPMTMVTVASAGATVTVQRIYGTDAIGTSIAVSQAEFPIPGSAKAVVLARSDFFSDALAGGPLAAMVGGPLLITPGAPLSSSLDPRVLAEIQRVLPVGGTVYILGGDLALSPEIDVSLQTLGYVTQRIAGANEYATAVDIAEQLGNPSTIFEATGLNFPDALSAVPAAIATNGAILLTDGATQAPETAAYLSAHPDDTRYAIGGPLAAFGAAPTAIPVYGQDLYGTAAAVATQFFPEATTFGAATGADFPDALSGGVFIGGQGAKGPMLLVEPSGALPPPIASYLSGIASTLTQSYLFGGPLAVGNDVLAELQMQQPTTPSCASSMSAPSYPGSTWAAADLTNDDTFQSLANWNYGFTDDDSSGSSGGYVPWDESGAAPNWGSTESSTDVLDYDLPGNVSQTSQGANPSLFSTYSPQTFSPSGCGLTLTATPYSATWNTLQDGAIAKSWTSGAINSYNHISFPTDGNTDVFVQIRAEMMGYNGSDNGAFNALWFLGQGQDAGEVDLQETGICGQSPDLICSHSFDPQGDPAVEVASGNLGEDLSIGYHTYGIELNNGELSVYVDNVPYGTALVGNNGPYFLLMNGSIASGQYSAAPSSDVNMSMKIAEVQVYQR